MGYLIFRGISTEGMAGVEVSRMPSHKKASMRYTEFYVKGRDGALHINEGYGNFDVTASLVLINSNAGMRQVINAWADGTGKLITSDDPTKAYLATVEDEVRWTRVKAPSGFFDTAEITFNCQPYMVEASEADIELTATGTVRNIGNLDAYPLIKIEGSGTVTFTFAGYPITLTGVVSNKPVYIDCENGYVYSESQAESMTGEIPSMIPGENTITFGSNVSKITITPHWRWL